MNRILLGVCFMSACMAAAPAMAASDGVTIDCTHFSKMPDGLWHADDKAVILVGDSRIDLAEAVISPQSMLIDGISLYSRLERKCAVSAPAKNQAGA